MHTLISAATVCRSVCVHLQLFACLFTHRRWPSFIVRPTTGADRQTRGDVEEGNGMRSLSADKCISDKRAAERLVILRIEWLQHPARMGVGKQNCAASWGGEGRGGGRLCWKYRLSEPLRGDCEHFREAPQVKLAAPDTTTRHNTRAQVCHSELRSVASPLEDSEEASVGRISTVPNRACDNFFPEKKRRRDAPAAASLD